MTTTLELNDGQIICEYDSKTGEVIEVFDWNGNEAHHRWYSIAEEAVAERMQDREP